MCIPPQDNSGQGPTAAQALRDTILIQQHGFTDLDQLKTFQQQNGPFGNQPQQQTQSSPQGAAPAPTAVAPPVAAPVQAPIQTVAPRASNPFTINPGLSITNRASPTLGAVASGSGLNVPL